MRSGMTAGVVLAASMMVTASAAAAHAAGTPTGNDVSYPQCGQALPSGQAFGVVAVNAGVANTTNPCLAAEITWAQASSGVAGQPRVSLYVNTANPGNHGVTDWPATNNNPLGGKLVSDPYGTCRGAINSGESSSANNRADLEGMASYFRRIGANVGIYSTPKQWDPLVGTVHANSPLYRLPDWIPGATTLSRAKKNCGLAPLTGGGTVTVVQWSTKPVNRDLACRAPSPKRASTR